MIKRYWSITSLLRSVNMDEHCQNHSNHLQTIHPSQKYDPPALRHWKVALRQVADPDQLAVLRTASEPHDQQVFVAGPSRNHSLP